MIDIGDDDNDRDNKMINCVVWSGYCRKTRCLISSGSISKHSHKLKPQPYVSGNQMWILSIDVDSENHYIIGKYGFVESG